jgi:hypothetical protein
MDLDRTGRRSGWSRSICFLLNDRALALLYYSPRPRSWFWREGEEKVLQCGQLMLIKLGVWATFAVQINLRPDHLTFNWGKDNTERGDGGSVHQLLKMIMTERNYTSYSWIPIYCDVRVRGVSKGDLLSCETIDVPESRTISVSVVQERAAPNISLDQRFNIKYALLTLPKVKSVPSVFSPRLVR